MLLQRYSPMILTAIIGFSIFLESSNVHAGGSNKNGNPYANGTFYPDSGTFSSIVRSTNGFLGTVQFTTTSSNASSTSTVSSFSSGLASVYAAGQQYTGVAYGVIDPSTKMIGVSYQAGYNFSAYVNTFTTNDGTVSISTAGFSNSISTNITSTVSPISSTIFTTNSTIVFATNPTTGVVQLATNFTITTTPTIIGYTNTLVTNYTTVANGIQKTTTNNPTVSMTSSLDKFSNSVSGQFSATFNNGLQIQTFSGTGEAHNIDQFSGSNTFYTTQVSGSRISQ